jgi:hypothetical protein
MKSLPPNEFGRIASHTKKAKGTLNLNGVMVHPPIWRAEGIGADSRFRLQCLP